MNSRKAARQAVAALLVAGIPDFQAVYDHEVLDPGGLSPIAIVQSDGTAPPTTFGADSRQQALIITISWIWTDTTEDNVDDLSDAVLDLIEANSEMDGIWSALSQDNTFSRSGYTDPIDGIVYRLESIRVIVE